MQMLQVEPSSSSSSKPAFRLAGLDTTGLQTAQDHDRHDNALNCDHDITIPVLLLLWDLVSAPPSLAAAVVVACSGLMPAFLFLLQVDNAVAVDDDDDEVEGWGEVALPDAAAAAAGSAASMADSPSSRCRSVDGAASSGTPWATSGASWTAPSSSSSSSIGVNEFAAAGEGQDAAVSSFNFQLSTCLFRFVCSRCAESDVTVRCGPEKFPIRSIVRKLRIASGKL